MNFSKMTNKELLQIIKSSEDKLRYSGLTLSNCLKAKINYLLLLLGKDIKYKEKKVIELMNTSYGTNYKWASQGSNGGYNPYAEDNLSGRQNVTEFWRNGYCRSDGVYISGHWVSSHKRYR